MKDPTIFATLTQADSYMKQVEIRELISLPDYRELEKLRVRNYVYILRILTKMNSSDDLYDTVKLKLYQIKPLITHLGLEFDNIYQRLEAD